MSSYFDQGIPEIDDDLANTKPDKPFIKSPIDPSGSKSTNNLPTVKENPKGLITSQSAKSVAAPGTAGAKAAASPIGKAPPLNAKGAVVQVNKPAMKTSPIVQDKKATTASAPAAGQKSNVNTVKQQPQSTLSPLSKLPNGIKPTPATAAPAAKTTTTAKPAAAVATKPLTNVKSNLPAAGKPAVATAKPGVKPATTTAATKTVAKPTTESTKSLPPLNGSGNSNTTHSKVNNLKINMDEVLEDDNKEEEVINKQIESSVKKFDTGTKSFVVNIRYVGRGNCAVVYKGVHVPSLTIVAIKEVKIIDEAIRKQFINELNALSCNRVFMTSNGTMSLPPCPFIVSFYDVFNDETKGRTCIVMEYMDGGSLQDIIAHNEGGIRDENALYNISYAIMKGINYLHSRHMIHRDIKPSNLLINHFGDVKLSDFGIVKELCNSYGIADTFVGTLPYMSPSRISAEEYSYGSDIWSFGLSIYVLAKGEFPYDKNKDYWTILEQIKDNPAPRLSTKEFSKEFCNFIEMCLNKDESKIPTINQLFSHPFFKGKKPVRSQNVYIFIIIFFQFKI